MAYLQHLSEKDIQQCYQTNFNMDVSQRFNNFTPNNFESVAHLKVNAL
jgi:hypothetical protein